MAKDITTPAELEQLRQRREHASQPPQPIADQAFWNHLDDPAEPAAPVEMDFDTANTLTPEGYAIARERELGIKPGTGDFGVVKPDMAAIRQQAGQVAASQQREDPAESYDRSHIPDKVFGVQEYDGSNVRQNRSSWRPRVTRGVNICD